MKFVLASTMETVTISLLSLNKPPFCVSMIFIYLTPSSSWVIPIFLLFYQEITFKFLVLVESYTLEVEKGCPEAQREQISAYQNLKNIVILFNNDTIENKVQRLIESCTQESGPSGHILLA